MPLTPEKQAELEEENKKKWEAEKAARAANPSEEQTRVIEGLGQSLSAESKSGNPSASQQLFAQPAGFSPTPQQPLQERNFSSITPSGQTAQQSMFAQNTDQPQAQQPSPQVIPNSNEHLAQIKNQFTPEQWLLMSMKRDAANNALNPIVRAYEDRLQWNMQFPESAEASYKERQRVAASRKGTPLSELYANAGVGTSPEERRAYWQRQTGQTPDGKPVRPVLDSSTVQQNMDALAKSKDAQAKQLLDQQRQELSAQQQLFSGARMQGQTPLDARGRRLPRTASGFAESARQQKEGFGTRVGRTLKKGVKSLTQLFGA